MTSSVSPLQRSESLRRGVRDKVLQIERSVVLSKRQIAESAKRSGEQVKRQVQLRIKDHVRHIQKAEREMRAADETVLETGSWITQLAHERYKQFAALQVCERRLEKRKELPQDSLHEALEIEQRVLNQARQDLMQLEADVKSVVAELKSLRVSLSRDAAHRRLEVESDRGRLVSVALASAQAPGARQIENPDGSTSVSVVISEEGVDTTTLCQRSQELQVRAAELQKLSRLRIKDVRGKCARAGARVNERLVRSTEETLEETRQLIGQGKEVDWTIDMARRSLTAQRKNIDLQDRRQESDFLAAQTMLEELRQSRNDLSHDLRQKTVLLNISESCRKVTAQQASVKQRRRPNTAGSTVTAGTNRRPNTAGSIGSTGRRARMLQAHMLPSLAVPSLANGDLTRSALEASTTSETLAPSTSPETVEAR